MKRIHMSNLFSRQSGSSRVKQEQRAKIVDRRRQNQFEAQKNSKDAGRGISVHNSVPHSVEYYEHYDPNSFSSPVSTTRTGTPEHLNSQESWYSNNPPAYSPHSDNLNARNGHFDRTGERTTGGSNRAPASNSTVNLLTAQLQSAFSELDQLKVNHGLALADVKRKRANDQAQYLENTATIQQKLQAVEGGAREHYKALKNSHTQELRQMEAANKQEHVQIAQKHAMELGAQQQQQNILEEQHTKEISRLDRAKRAEILGLKDAHQTEVNALQQQHAMELSTLQQNLKKSEERHKQEVGRLHGASRADILNLKHEHKTELSVLQQQQQRLEEGYIEELNQIDQAKRGEILALKHSHKTEINTWERKLRNMTREAEQRREELVSNQDQKLSKLTKDHSARMSDKQAELNQLARRFEAQISENALQYQMSMQKLRDEVERLNTALLTNDDDQYRGELFTASGLPAKPDDKIHAQFSAIEQMVDSIGRLPWKQYPSVWTNEKLQRIRGDHGDRMLKKAIVQDLVWSLLYDYVFGSPFRVFQEEGRSLEMQWSRACGQDDNGYGWPAPGVKTERWRYMTIKECREALRPPVPSDLDPRSRLRKGFTQSLEGFESAATTSLGNIVNFSTDDIDMIRRLFKKAATIWLEFAAHRCRIVIRLKRSAKTPEAKVAMAESSGLELTVVPRVGRYGNVMGTELDSYKIIDRCDGESIIVGR